MKQWIDSPSIVETHGGYGRLWQRCYSDVSVGVVFEKDSAKAEVLSVQRSGWAVYETDCLKALAAGIGFQFSPTLFDLDPYGDPWPIIETLAAHSDKWGNGPIAFVVNDGLRAKAQTGSAWVATSLGGAVKHFGNHNIWRDYLKVCHWKMSSVAEQVSRRMTRWQGYHCGHNGTMTHYAALLSELK